MLLRGRCILKRSEACHGSPLVQSLLSKHEIFQRKNNPELGRWPLPYKLEDQSSDLQNICKCQLRVVACLDSQPSVGGDGVPRASQLAIVTKSVSFGVDISERLPQYGTTEEETSQKPCLHMDSIHTYTYTHNCLEMIPCSIPKCFSERIRLINNP